MRGPKRNFVVERGTALRTGRLRLLAAVLLFGAVAANLRQPAMPGQTGKPGALCAVLAGPFVNRNPAFDVYAAAFRELIRSLVCFLVERHHAYPVHILAIAHAHVEAQIQLAGLRRFLLGVTAETAEERCLDAAHWSFWSPA